MAFLRHILLSLLLVQLAYSQVPSTLQKTLFYEDPAVSERIFNQPLVDRMGNVIAVATQGSVGCSFGICGVTVYSISPSGTLNWKKPDTGFAAAAVNQMALGDDGTIYFQGFWASGLIYAFAPDGTPVAGWPVNLGFPLDTAPHTLLVDPVDGSIVVKAGTNFSFGTFPGSIAAFHPDTSSKWRTDFTNAANNTPGIVIGPDNIFFTYSDQGVTLDRNNGQQLCSYGQRFAALAGGPDGAFTYDGAQIFRIAADCSLTSIFMTTQGAIEVQSYDNGIVFAIDYPNNPFNGSKIRLLAVRADGTFLWRNDAILPVGGGVSRISTIGNGRLYVIGQDTVDQKQKLFILDENTGNIIDAFDTTGTCVACGVAISTAGNIYLNDLQSTNIYLLSRIPEIGIISVSTNNNAATYTVCDGGRNRFAGSGIDFKVAAPPSTYSIIYGDIPGFISPKLSTEILLSNTSINFSGLYISFPTLTASSSMLSFLFQQGIAGPITPQKLTITTDGVPISVSTITSTSTIFPWLTIGPEQGTTPEDLSISVQMASLQAGIYNGAIEINSSTANNSPLTIPVTLIVSPPKERLLAPQRIGGRKQLELVEESTTDFSVLLESKETIIQSDPTQITAEITIENNWNAWYFVTLRGVGSTSQNLPSSFLLGPRARHTLEVAFRKDESVSFTADASLAIPPQSAQDFELLSVYGAELLWRAASGSPLPQDIADFAVWIGSRANPFVDLAITARNADILGILAAIEKIRNDPFLSTRLTALGLPIAEKIRTHLINGVR